MSTKSLLVSFAPAPPVSPASLMPPSQGLLVRSFAVFWLGGQDPRLLLCLEAKKATKEASDRARRKAKAGTREGGTFCRDQARAVEYPN